jgi:hypothetical protein
MLNDGNGLERRRATKLLLLADRNLNRVPAIARDYDAGLTVAAIMICPKN